MFVDLFEKLTVVIAANVSLPTAVAFVGESAYNHDVVVADF